MNSDALTFDAGLPLLVIGGALLLVLAVLLWHERRIATRPAWLPALFLLRTLAIGGVAFALSAPTAVRTIRRETPRHTVAALDASASMRLQDPAAAAANARRWQNTPPAPLDEASALLATAQVLVTKALDAVDTGPMRRALNAAAQAAREASAALARADDEGGRLAPLRRQLATEALEPLERWTQSSGTRETAHAPLRSVATRLAEMSAALRPIAEAAAARSTADATPLPSRMQCASRWLDLGENSWLGEFSQRTALQRLRFAQKTAPHSGLWSTITPDAPEAADASTDLQQLFEELSRRASTARLDLAILVTDGGHNTSDAPPTVPAALAGVPLIVVPIGSAEPRRDLDLQEVTAPERVMKDADVTVEARISTTLCEGGQTVVELRSGEQILDTQELRPSGPRSVERVELHWRAEEPGTRELSVRVRPLERELNLRNNERTLRVAVEKQASKVFIADALPRWETRYLLRLFERDTQMAGTPVLFAPPAATGQLPMSLAAWQEFPVVILGDLSPAQLTEAHQHLLRQYVEAGGNLVLIAGAEAMPQAFRGGPLAELLPVTAEPLATARGGCGVRLTPEGRIAEALRISEAKGEDDAALWSAIFQALPIYDLSTWSRPKPAARVLLEAVPSEGAGPPRALLATHSYGRGTVAFFASPCTWHLRWRHGDRYHYRFWGQFARALAAKQLGAGGPFARLRSDKLSYRPGEPVRVRLWLKSAGGEPLRDVEAHIAAHAQGRMAAAAEATPIAGVPGEYEATLVGLPAGKYDLAPTGAALTTLLREGSAALPGSSIAIEPPDPTVEMAPFTQPPPFFQTIARAPSVMLVAPGAVPAVLKYFALEPTKTESTERTPLWNRWPLLLAILGLLSVEWIGRKFAGLI